MPVGVVSLAENYGAAASSRTGFDRMFTDLRARLAPFAREMGADFDPRKYHLLGTSGTVTTLAAIALKLPRYNRTRVDGSWHETRPYAEGRGPAGGSGHRKRWPRSAASGPSAPT